VTMPLCHGKTNMWLKGDLQ